LLAKSERERSYGMGRRSAKRNVTAGAIDKVRAAAVTKRNPHDV
jgi:hypothetical protein